MKKILLALIVGVLLSCCVLSAVCFAGDGNAASSAEEYKNTQEYILTKQFCENYGDRSKQDNEIKVANALADEFKAIDGMDVDLQTGINVETSQTTYQTANVVAKLDTPSKKIVVIGAHYDNAGTGEGAADNATGIVTMYLLAKRLAEVKSSLPFDVYFVAFGGEEQGLCGSKYFVKDLKQNGDLGNVLVMFNLDGIAGGDDLYVQCENKSTDLENLLVASSKNLSTKLNVKPYAAGISAMVDAYGYGYYETTQNSDHTPFRLEGVPTALFFSGSFSYLDGYSESADATKRVSNTSQDTFKNLEANRGAEFVKKMQTVNDILFNAITSAEFGDVALQARSQLVNVSAAYGYVPSVVTVVLALIAAITVLSIRSRIAKSISTHTRMSAPSGNDDKFVKPSADDVFSFDPDEK